MPARNTKFTNLECQNLKVNGTTTGVTAAANISSGGTVATGNTLAVTDADALTIAGKKVHNLLVATFQFGGDGTGGFVPEAITTQGAIAFIAPRACKLVAVKERHAKTTQATAATIGVKKVAAGQAYDYSANSTQAKPLLSAELNLKATVNTTQAGALTATTADLTLAAGDVIYVGITLTSLSGTVGTGMLQLEFEAV